MPWTLVSKQVLLRVDETSVLVFFDDRRVATHAQRSVCDAHLPEHRGDYRHRSRQYWIERAQQMGPEVANYIEEVFDSDDVLSQLRTVQAMVKHLGGLSRSRAQGAYKRARYYGRYRYGALKRFLKNALDLTPLANAGPRAAQEPRRLRFPFNPKVPKAKVIDLGACHFIDKRVNVLLVGPTGVGKSHIAQALGQRACMAGHPVLYVSAHRTLSQLRASRADHSYFHQARLADRR